METFNAQGKKKANASMLSINLKNVSVIEEFNPRQDTGDVEELKKSIAKQGIINPPTVRPTETEGEYQLIAGHRRFRALSELGRESAPFIIRTDLAEFGKATAYAIAENSEDGRVNLTHVELGNSFILLHKTEGWGPGKIATESGVAVHTVRRCMKLMELDASILDLVQNGNVSITAALAFAKLAPEVQDQIDLGDLPDPSAHLINTLAKDAGKKLKALAAENATPGEDNDTEDNDGKESGQVKVVWRSKTEIKKLIERRAYDALSKESDTSEDSYTMLKVLYWQRNEFETIADAKPGIMKRLMKADSEKYMEKMERDAAKGTKKADNDE